MNERNIDGMGMALASAARTKAQAESHTTTPLAEALRTLDKDSLNLSDLNPLIHGPQLGSRDSVDALVFTAYKKIKANEGLMPQMIESTTVFDGHNTAFRFIARFETQELDENQLQKLEDLVATTYGVAVRTRKDAKGNDIPTESYPPIQFGEELLSKTGGWYMGPDVSPTTSLHAGLFVFKDLGQVNKDNFFNKEESSSKFVVEIREAAMYQTDLVAFVTQVASVLGNGELLDQGQLLYETYYDLIRLGLKKADSESSYGMDEAMDLINRGLLTPLASPDIARGVEEDPQSVLLVGVPGTGKTLIVEQLLQEETGIFILPMDPLDLQKEFKQPKEKQHLFQRIAEVGRITGKKVVIHIDDIENMVGEDVDTHSTMLNIMAGVRESGFHIIASTNYPEKIDPALLQPQRFGITIHCGLQDENARYEILKIHSGLESKREGYPLFGSEIEREIILRDVAANTDFFTPRYLAAIANSAKSFLIERVSREKGKRIGLTEGDLTGHSFSVEDWDKAVREVSARYDKGKLKSRDEELKRFVDKHSKGQTGFVLSPDRMNRGVVILKDSYARINDIRNSSDESTS